MKNVILTILAIMLTSVTCQEIDGYKNFKFGISLSDAQKIDNDIKQLGKEQKSGADTLIFNSWFDEAFKSKAGDGTTYNKFIKKAKSEENIPNFIIDFRSNEKKLLIWKWINDYSFFSGTDQKLAKVNDLTFRFFDGKLGMINKDIPDSPINKTGAYLSALEKKYGSPIVTVVDEEGNGSYQATYLKYVFGQGNGKVYALVVSTRMGSRMRKALKQVKGEISTNKEKLPDEIIQMLQTKMADVNSKDMKLIILMYADKSILDSDISKTKTMVEQWRKSAIKRIKSNQSQHVNDLMNEL